MSSLLSPPGSAPRATSGGVATFVTAAPSANAPVTLSARGEILPQRRRSFTPMPTRVMSQPVDPLSRSLTSLVVPSTLEPDVAAFRRAADDGVQAPSMGSSPSGAIGHRMASGSALVDPGRGAGGEPKPPQRSRSFQQLGPANVHLNIYFLKKVDFDEQGRVQRRIEGNDLTTLSRLWKDLIGVYHVGLEVHGEEYTFGNYHGINSRQLGGASSGVYRHDPKSAGPHCVFKQHEVLGTTVETRDRIEAICARMGNTLFGKSAYNLVHHNCVNFSRNLAMALGCETFPSWCHKGADMAKLFGMGGEPPAEAQALQAQAPVISSGDDAPAESDSQPAMQPPPLDSGMGRISPIRRASPVRVGRDELAASNTMISVGIPSKPAVAAEPLEGRRVSVWQSSTGACASGRVLRREADGNFVVQYDNPPYQESGVPESSLVLLPEVPLPLAQACRGGLATTAQPTAGSVVWSHQASSVQPVIAGGVARHMSPVPHAQPVMAMRGACVPAANGLPAKHAPTPQGRPAGVHTACTFGSVIVPSQGGSAVPGAPSAAAPCHAARNSIVTTSMPAVLPTNGQPAQPAPAGWAGYHPSRRA